MSEQDRFENEEEKDEVEAHKRRTAMSDDQNASDDESPDDFEAHRRVSS